jgi:spore photoproduct lyase
MASWIAPVNRLLRTHRTPLRMMPTSALRQPSVELEEWGAPLLEAAEKVAQKGVRVGFHFHPMIYYDEWETAYPNIAREIVRRFDPQAVLFISMGSVTMIKPVMRQIRQRGFKTKILQMELVPDPHGKWTYPDAIKIRMFRTMYQAFSEWHEKVFFYLCMEKAAIWQGTFGRVFPNNDAFEQALLNAAFAKINP